MKILTAAFFAGACLLGSQAAADFVPLWEIGTDNNTQSDFSQESFGPNAPPGTVSSPSEVPPGSENLFSYNLPSKDDDYYFAGTYPDPIGVVGESEPWKAFERAMTDGDTTKRLHFTLDALQAAATNRLKFTVDLFALGSASVGAGNHDVQVSVNGQEIHSQTGIVADTLIEKTVTGGAVNAVEGENILEVTRTGGSSSSWIQFDYLRAEIDTSLCSDALCDFSSTATTVNPGGSATLRWVASPSSSLTLDPGAINVTPLTANGLGSTIVTPDGTTTYILTANKAGTIQARQITITVPTLVSFVSNRRSLSLNEGATLSWQADPHATLTIDQGIGSVNAATGADGKGSLFVLPGNVEKTYTMTATRGPDTTQQSITLGYGQFGAMWQLGVDDNNQAEFHQEVGGANPAPGSATVLDDDYYLVGPYPDPIGTLFVDEPLLSNFERAVTGGGTTTRVHFTMALPEPNPGNRIRLTVDLIAGGWYDPATGDAGAGFGTHDVGISFNGESVWSQTDITAPMTAEATFTAGSVNAVVGENIVEIVRTGGVIEGNPANVGWIQFDYLQAEIDTNPVAPFTITGVSRNPATREITLTWSSSTGSQYLVESSTDLVTWPDLVDDYPAGGATGPSTSYTHLPPVGTAKLFYRVTQR